MAVTQGAVAPAAVATPTTKVRVPEPKSYCGARNAKEIDNFIWSLEQYFKAIGVADHAKKIECASLYLQDTAMVWWRRRHGDIEKGTCTMDTWDDFKRELKR